MTTCTYSISARTGQTIPSSYPCGKSADEGGLCRRHRREADAAEARTRAEREPATVEQQGLGELRQGEPPDDAENR